MTCDFCLAMSGRFNANNACCQVRLLVGAPAQHRKQVYERTKQSSGATAVAELKARVRVEYQRQQAWRENNAQQAQAEETAKGRAALSVLRETMKGLGLPLRSAAASAGQLLKSGLMPEPNHPPGFAS